MAEAEFQRRWKARTDAEIEAQIEESRAQADAERDKEIRATSVRYDAPSGRMVLELSNGCAFAFPAHLGQGLAGASTEDLAAVEITPSGTGLHWEKLDADLRVEALMRGVFGTKRHMAALGAAGGAARSEAKTAAARANGAKGGRPRKKVAGS